MGKDEPMLEVRNLSVSYSGRKVLDDVSFSLFEGDLAVLTGPSGSGKSTVLKCLNRLSIPDSGRILLRGYDISQEKAPLLRRRIVLVGQIPAMFPGTVRENLLYPFTFRSNAGLEKPDMSSVLLSTGLREAILEDDAGKLSVGEQQRVAIARALVLSPQILLLDEPTASLDEVSKNLMEDLICDLSRRSGLTILLVTHDKRKAEKVSNRSFALRDKKITETT